MVVLVEHEPVTPNLRTTLELAAFLADGSNDDRVYSAATENRSSWYASKGSTSCGDLLHCVAFAAGCRSLAINRSEHKGWTPGVNLSRWFVPPFVGGHARIWRPSKGEIHPGDFGCYDYSSSKAHGFVVLGWDGDTLVTADLGQPRGKILRCAVAVRQGIIFARARQLDCIVPHESISFTAEPETVGQWQERKGLLLLPWLPAEYLP